MFYEITITEKYADENVSDDKTPIGPGMIMPYMKPDQIIYMQQLQKLDIGAVIVAANK